MVGRSQAGRPFQSTLLMRGATKSASGSRAKTPISIHAPHARSDLKSSIVASLLVLISIHAPHARSDEDARSFPPG